MVRLDAECYYSETCIVHCIKQSITSSFELLDIFIQQRTLSVKN